MGSIFGYGNSLKYGEVRFDGDPERMKPSEVKVYYIDPEKIQEKYGPPKVTKHQLMRLLGEGKTLTEIGKVYGIPGQKVSELINYYQINKKNNKEEITMGPKLQEAVKILPKEQMIKYIEEGKKDREIAELSGLEYTRVRQLKRFYCLTPATKGRENEQGFNVDMLPKTKNENNNDSVKPAKEKNEDSLKLEEYGANKHSSDNAEVEQSDKKCNCLDVYENILTLAAEIKKGRVPKGLQWMFWSKVWPKELLELYDALTVIVNSIVAPDEIKETSEENKQDKSFGKNIVFNFNFGDFGGGK